MSEPVKYEFIRGDDFVIPMSLTNPDNNGLPVDITGWTITSQVRYSKKLISDLQVVITDATQGAFTISAPTSETQVWPARELKCDIQFDRPGDGRVSSQTFIIDVSEDQTQ
ncbi:virion protein [Roseobacter phage RD-1410W1-01]|uniref:Virion protein n=1 Tax=Roseobacter phage RD-1410W1-01 TaxID=1815984 RepID=A0A191VYI3_9CAUD|nr:virion protein [Roseobacter phage RD-1410W1-01]ANJ20770.1 virion protein [Roseobacter phage RD-1410W1-01]